MKGISESEALARRRSGQGNDAAFHPGRSYARIVWENSANPVNVVLFSVSAVLVSLGLELDAAITAIPTLFNIVFNAGLEANAKRRLDQLRILASPSATVLRDGQLRSVDQADLVLGDAVVVERGDQIQLDGKLLEGEIDVDESLLTGEAEPVTRHPGEDLLSGSVCVSGRGLYEVVRVGLDSYANQLTKQAQSATAERTPLQRDIAQLITIASVAVLIVTIIDAISYVVAGRDLQAGEMAQAAAVLVALVPQGLAIMLTVAYATGALRISRAGALVQRNNAIESMSRVDTLITDKTGTITSPRYEVREVRPFGVDGVAAGRLLRAVVDNLPTGDRIADALRSSSSVASDPSGELVDRVPFASSRRWSGVVVKGGPGQAVVLGAPEALTAALNEDVTDAFIRPQAAQGLRVLVLATAETGSLHDVDGKPRLPDQLTLAAVLTFAEELRPDAAPTLQQFQAAGIDIKVVSGDNPVTVAAIANRAGISGSTAGALTGPDLDALSDSDLGDEVDAAHVVGRVEPRLKARIVQALRARGRYVAMVGDGVNDILAIKQAQLGVAMESGSSASRAVADIVLLGDRFSILPAAISEGRRIIDGMRGSMMLLLTRTWYMLLILLGASFFGLAFPMTPRNNAVLALVTVGLPAIVLVAFARPVAPPKSLVRSTLQFSVPMAAAVAVIALPVYAHYLDATGSVPLSRSALTTLVVFCGILLIPLVPRAPSGAQPDDERPDARVIALMVAMLIIYGLIASNELARSFYELEPLPLTDVAALGLIAGAWAIVVGGLRRIFTALASNRSDRTTTPHPV